MSDTRRDEIITSASADRMLGRVSPIYGNSYVGLWMFEAIGREYDLTWDIIRTLPDQLFPETATWMLGLWEQRYGIQPGIGSITERRNRVLLKRSGQRPNNPARLQRTLEMISGSSVRIVNNIAPYTFGVYITASPSSDITDKVKAEIDRVKPSHMSYNVIFDQSTQVQILAVGVFSYGKKFTIRQVN